jgi:hypothetical protein
MKRPKWATIVGILAIIFGCLGVLTGGQQVMMPKIIKMQKEMFTEFSKNIEKHQAEPSSSDNNINDQTKNSEEPVSPDISKYFDKMFDLPPWFGKWSLISGVLKSLVSALYLFAGIWLLLMKQNSIRLFYFAAGVSIALSIVELVVYFSTSSFMIMAVGFGNAFGLLIDIVLIIVVVTGDKSAFQALPVLQPVTPENESL